MNQDKKINTPKASEAEEAKQDLLALADISTDKQLEDIKKGKLKKKDETRKQQPKKV